MALLLKYGVVGGKDAKEMEFMLGAVGVHYIRFSIRFLSSFWKCTAVYRVCTVWLR